MGFIVSVVAGAILFGLYNFIVLELGFGGAIQDINLYLIINAVIYSIALGLTGVVLSQTLKPSSIVTWLVLALLVGITTTGFSLIATSIDDMNMALLLGWVRRVIVAVLMALVLSNFNKMFGTNGEPRLSLVFMVIVIVLLVGIDWGSSEIINNLNVRTMSDARLSILLIGGGTGALVTALLFLALKFSNSPLQRGGGQQMMYQQQPPYNQYPPRY